METQQPKDPGALAYKQTKFSQPIKAKELKSGPPDIETPKHKQPNTGLHSQNTRLL